MRIVYVAPGVLEEVRKGYRAKPEPAFRAKNHLILAERGSETPMRSNQYSVFFSLGSSVLLGVWASTCLVGCRWGDPDGRTVRGALAAAAEAIEAQDARKLFRLIDQRGRNALASIAHSHALACKLIEADYPENERAAALSTLGDCGHTDSPEALFAARCDATCMHALAVQLGAPEAEVVAGDEVVVRTTRGTSLHMHAGKDHWYGLVWKTPELIEERTQAARELQAITENAAVYRKRRELERGGDGTGK
jgi:hypothetical protein